MQTVHAPLLTIAVSDTDRQEVIRMLAGQKLPVTDIGENTVLYLLKEGDQPVGTAGLDIFEDCALLRSISVISPVRGKGYGKALNGQIEQYAKESGISCLYLITNTAKDFFNSQGYCVIDRAGAPDAVKQTDQFSSLCPSTAVVMKKRI